MPLGPIEESSLHDKDAKAVMQYAIDEQKAQEEQLKMSANDPLSLALRDKLVKELQVNWKVCRLWMMVLHYTVDQFM